MSYTNRLLAWSWSFLICLSFGAAAQQTSPPALLEELNNFPHAEQLDFSETEVLDHEVGLGAIQKVGGAWRFKDSERVNGLLTRYTWQIKDGFTSREVLADLESKIDTLDDPALLYSCDGRACGKGVQWANRVFRQPILYGREDLQSYRVFSLGKSPQYLLMMYASARTADRQYLHMELLRVGDVQTQT
ncbi:MAG: DUF4892 domain-containing protein [Pseudomonadota bacterium]